MKIKKLESIIITLLLVLCLMGCGMIDGYNGYQDSHFNNSSINNTVSYDALYDLEFNGEPYVVINNNEPYFYSSEITEKSYESYSELDSFGRCGVAMACVGIDIMPTEKRGSIGSIKPSGWQSMKYDFVDGKYLYNRCHLIGFQLTGENANEKNLITGTRYLNVDGMLPFENMIADYVKETENHVLYRVTPVFKGNNLLASGVLMEAYSVEDEGEGICFNVYAFNNQPGVKIDYATGLSIEDKVNIEDKTESEYVLNTKSKKIHLPTCSYVDDISDKNKEISNKSYAELVSEGYSQCGQCKP